MFERAAGNYPTCPWYYTHVCYQFFLCWCAGLVKHRCEIKWSIVVYFGKWKLKSLVHIISIIGHNTTCPVQQIIWDISWYLPPYVISFSFKYWKKKCNNYLTAFMLCLGMWHINLGSIHINIECNNNKKYYTLVSICSCYHLSIVFLGFYMVVVLYHSSASVTFAYLDLIQVKWP